MKKKLQNQNKNIKDRSQNACQTLNFSLVALITGFSHKFPKSAVGAPKSTPEVPPGVQKGTQGLLKNVPESLKNDPETPP